MSSNCKKCPLYILTIFLSFRKSYRKCWKNCALPVFFDNNNMKKKNRSRLFLFFLLRAWLWSLRVPLISIVQASKPTRRRHKGLGIFFVFSCVLSFHSIISIYSGQISQKSVKRFIRLLFDFFDGAQCCIIVKHTFTKRYLKEDSFCEPFVLASFFFSDFGLRTSYLQSLNSNDDIYPV